MGMKVEKKPPTVEHKTFDPAHPPKDLPELNPGESAVTTMDYGCASNISYRVTSKKKVDDKVHVEVKVYGVEVSTQLKIVVWVPTGATTKLKAHEEGHRQIAETVYKSADVAAKAAADKVQDRRLSGDGDTEKDAVQAALTAASKQLGDEYLRATSGQAERLNQIYDELTAHGTKKEPAEPEAIRLAFEQYAKEVKDAKAAANPAPSTRKAGAQTKGA
jgi:hypothetical protein